MHLRALGTPEAGSIVLPPLVPPNHFHFPPVEDLKLPPLRDGGQSLNLRRQLKAIHIADDFLPAIPRSSAADMETEEDGVQMEIEEDDREDDAMSSETVCTSDNGFNSITKMDIGFLVSRTN